MDLAALIALAVGRAFLSVFFVMAVPGLDPGIDPAIHASPRHCQGQLCVQAATADFGAQKQAFGRAKQD
jgi:hypothetical protein